MNFTLNFGFPQSNQTHLKRSEQPPGTGKLNLFILLGLEGVENVVNRH